MSWWKRIKGIKTETSDKKEAPDGVWYKCPECKQTVPSAEHKTNFYVCPGCERHERISAQDYFDILFDNRVKELFGNLISKDELEFVDLKAYDARLEATKKKTGLNDAMKVGVGRIDGERAVVSAMDFAFIGGSMGSVVGEKIARSVDYCIEKKLPLIIISKSGGARMMESAFSLMQMAKTSAKLYQLGEAGLPYISFLTDPTTGGVSASYAMLGDINIAEPRALIGFAGPRVIKETIGKDLPEGFQSSEFLLEHGFLDFIVERKDLKEKIAEVLRLFKN